PIRSLPLNQVESLPEWQKWEFAEDIYDQSGTNLVITALSKLNSTNLAKAASLGRNPLRVLDGREGQERKWMTAIWVDKEGRYQQYEKTITKPYWLKSEESAAVTERLESLVGEVERALPN